jgi:hypothetical protein
MSRWGDNMAAWGQDTGKGARSKPWGLQISIVARIGQDTLVERRELRSHSHEVGSMDCVCVTCWSSQGGQTVVQWTGGQESSGHFPGSCLGMGNGGQARGGQ